MFMLRRCITKMPAHIRPGRLTTQNVCIAMGQSLNLTASIRLCSKLFMTMHARCVSQQFRRSKPMQPHDNCSQQGLANHSRWPFIVRRHLWWPLSRVISSLRVWRPAPMPSRPWSTITSERLPRTSLFPFPACSPDRTHIFKAGGAMPSSCSGWRRVSQTADSSRVFTLSWFPADQKGG